MNVWIFVITAMFNPVVEPLGLSLDNTPMPPVVAEAEATPETTEIRYRGIERLFARSHAEAQ